MIVLIMAGLLFFAVTNAVDANKQEQIAEAAKATAVSNANETDIQRQTALAAQKASDIERQTAWPLKKLPILINKQQWQLRKRPILQKQTADSTGNSSSRARPGKRI